MTWDKTIGTSQDYSTITNWEDNIPDADSGDKQMVYGRCTDEDFNESVVVSPANWTPDASNYIQLCAQSGTSFDGIPGNGPRIHDNPSYDYVLELLTDFCRCIEFEIENTSTLTARHGLLINGEGWVVDKIIGAGGGNVLSFKGQSGTRSQASNIVVHRSNNSNGIIVYKWAEYLDLTNAVVTNCSIGVGVTSSDDSGRLHMYNVVAYDNTTNWNYLNDSNKSHNASDDASTDDIPGTDSVNGVSDSDFNDAGNSDYSLSGTESTLYDVGVGTTQSEVTSEDIVGESRESSTCDIGAFEFVSAGGTTVTAYCVDGLSLSDVPSRTAIFSASVQDGISLGDADSNIAQLLAEAEDGTSFGDTLLALAQLQAQASSGVRLSDTITSTVAIIAQAADGITASDQISAIATLLGQISDAVSVGDTPTGTATLRPTVADGASFSDATTAQILSDLVAYCADGISLFDASGATGTFRGQVTDGVKLSEALSATLQAIASASDGIILSDSTTWAGILSALAADGIQLSDAASRTIRLLAQAADSITLSDAGQATAIYTVECTDGVQFAETVAAVMQFAAACSDGVNFSDVAVETSTLPSGRVTVSFSVKGASISFTVKGPSINFQ